MYCLLYIHCQRRVVNCCCSSSSGKATFLAILSSILCSFFILTFRHLYHHYQYYENNPYQFLLLVNIVYHRHLSNIYSHLTYVIDWSLAVCNMEDFCTLLTNQLPNLKHVSFTNFKSFRGLQRKLPHTVIDQNESSKYIVKLVHFLVDHLQQLVSLCISFNSTSSITPYLPPTIRQQLYEWPLNRSYRLRCLSEEIQIWL
jgi:hypothetical protein